MDIVVPKEQAARKQVTVLFCDIADYTLRSNSMDPEDLADEIRVFQQLCTRVSEKYHGHISNFLGDGILVLFGHPYASEFDPQHAVRASLEIIDEIKQINSSFEWRNRRPITVRVGIATSLVVVGERAGKKRDQDEQIFGEAPNLAARLQEIAAPDTVVVSLRTRRLIGSTFRFQELGDHDLKGFSQPVKAWQLLHERAFHSRNLSSLKRVTTRFVSRQKELSILTDNYEASIGGAAQIVYLIGEAGIGKSRLLRVFEKTLKSQDIFRLRVNCSPYFQSTPLKSVLEEVCRWLSIKPKDNDRRCQIQARRGLAELDIHDDKALALFCEILDVEPPQGVHPDTSMGEEKHLRTIRFLARLVYGMCKLKPVMLVVEDLHWADPTTLDLLELITASGNNRSLFTVATSRIIQQPPWEKNRAAIVVQLNGLDADSSSALIRSVFENTPLPPRIEETLIRKSEGYPFYLEEYSWHILNQLRENSLEQIRDSDLTIPDTLQDSLNARLDQLGIARSLAQLASTFSGHFTYSQIRRIADLNRIEADSSMDELLQTGVLRIIPQAAEDQYAFEHILFQDAAYHSLLRKTRQRYHRQIAEMFVQEDPYVVEGQPELIAYHYSQTDQVEIAVTLWMQAARIAIAKSAIAEAMDHLDRGIQLLPELPEDEMPGYELELLANMAVCRTVGSGYYGEEVEQIYRRCIDLADRVGTPEQRWNAQYGFWRCLICQGDFSKSLNISVRLKRLSESLDDRALRMTSLGIQGMTRLFAAKFQSAEEYFQASVQSYDYLEDHKIGIKFGQDPYVTIQGLYAVNQLIRNDRHQSKLEIEKSVDVARSIGHPYTIAETLRLAAMYAQISRDMVALKQFAGEAVVISEKFGFRGLLAASRIFMSFCNVVTFRCEDSLSIIRDELEQYKEKYGYLFFPYFQGLLAEAYLYMDQYQDAFTESSHVLKLIEEYGEVWTTVPALLTRIEAASGGHLVGERRMRGWYDDAERLAVSQKANLFVERVQISRKTFDSASEGPLSLSIKGAVRDSDQQVHA